MPRSWRFGIDDAPAPQWRAGTTSSTGCQSGRRPRREIGVVGKYVGLQDAYKSLTEALVHGGMANRVKVRISWLDAELFEHPEADIPAQLEPLHGILVPGGFGERGSEGKIASVHFARSARFPSSESASECRWPASRRRGTSPASKAPQAPNSARPRSPSSA
jgi:CTP synthase